MALEKAQEQELLIRDKYAGNRTVDLTEDLARLTAGEPLAYVIGWVPFLNTRIELDSRPLIPRPETEWWTEELVQHLKERFEDKPFTLLDLCAGSGAIGISVLTALPHARVSFGELDAAHVEQIRKNLAVNSIDPSKAEVRESNLFSAFDSGARFDFIATNPPYVPSSRTLEDSVTSFEPALALYAGSDGLDLIRIITREAREHLLPDGELWMECDVSNISEAATLLQEGGASSTEIRTDPYGRPRIVVGYYL